MGDAGWQDWLHTAPTAHKTTSLEVRRPGAEPSGGTFEMGWQSSEQEFWSLVRTAHVRRGILAQRTYVLACCVPEAIWRTPPHTTWHRPPAWACTTLHALAANHSTKRSRLAAFFAHVLVFCHMPKLSITAPRTGLAASSTPPTFAYKGSGFAKGEYQRHLSGVWWAT